MRFGCCPVGSRSAAVGEGSRKACGGKSPTGVQLTVCELLWWNWDVRAVARKTAQIAAHGKLTLLSSNSTLRVWWRSREVRGWKSPKGEFGMSVVRKVLDSQGYTIFQAGGVYGTARNLVFRKHSTFVMKLANIISYFLTEFFNFPLQICAPSALALYTMWIINNKILFL
jgi:hypothetical protein